jgi:hypothetical protein
MYDVVYGIFVSLVQISFELIEYSLEVFIQHFFHTNDHQSEIIMIDVLFVLALCGLFLLWYVLLRFKRKVVATWLSQKKCARVYWETLTILQKIKLVLAYSIGFISILFLFVI